VTVRVITDSAATIPADLAAQLGIVVVPLWLAVGAESYRDGELEPEALLARTEEASTSGPTPADFLTAIEEYAGDDGAVIATISHDMAESTFLAARAAAGLAAVATRVVDTASAAGGEGLVVLEAAGVAAAGGSIDEVEAAVVRAAERVRLVAMLPNLDHLVRSGHVPEAAAWAARWIGLRPVVELRRGKVSPLAPALSEAAARRRVFESWRRTRPAGPAALHLAALHSMAEAEAGELLDLVLAEIEPATAFVGSFGSAMLLHSGPGVAGLAWWWDP
jgi:DegV family protein with EDD domain